MIAHHDTFLVTLSVVIAILGSYTALDLFRRVRATGGQLRARWLAAAAIGMGLSIWSMHFIAMLAFDVGLPVVYDLALTMLSLLLAIAVTGAAFAAVANVRSRWPHIMVAGLFMGLGICGMHYLGMAAIRLPAALTYNSPLVALSLLIAVGASSVALVLALHEQTLPWRAAGAIALGLAILGMHYVAMLAATFTPIVGHPASLPGMGLRGLALNVAVATFIILLLSLAAAMVDRRLGEMAAREAEALRQSEERLRALVRNASDFIAVLDAGGIIRYKASSTRQVIGYNGEILGTALTRLVPPEEQDKAIRFVRSAVEHPERSAREILTIRRRDGSLRVFDAIASNLLEEPAVGGIVVNLRDISERRELERKLAEVQKAEAIGQLTGGIAHDFNNLLTVIAGNLELLAREDDPETKRRMVANVQAAVGRGERLTQQLLAFTQQQRLDPEAVDMNSVAAQAVERLGPELGSKITLETCLAAGIGSAYADRQQVETALLHLLRNACEAMPDGGTVTLSTDEVMLEPSDVAGRPDMAPGPCIVLRIADTGAGMPRAVLERATEPFFTTKEAGKNTGLGLSQAFGFARQSHGDLRISSRPDAGTMVEIYLPRAELEAREPDRNRTKAAPFPSARTQGQPVVLVVEDEFLVLEVTAMLLGELGYEVLKAGNGIKAMEILKEDRPIHLLFTDVIMPGGMSGFDVAREARRLRQDIRILFASGYSGSVEQHPDTPRAPLLAKPYGPEQLAREVSAVLAA
jgi:PAS domain S-box-containing protein